ncbi:MAG TPA: tripartite tricarboxylate transporter substrate binding protein [Casimicrobiaceae bacterium]|jgi:tripartite-type tricarboxylate transporter receptor subunit TctC|nr:tripartite tricarboxylate transporter substrate binding protein [Casimicrobiaceae bacterium]
MTRNPTPGRVLAACIAIVAALTWQPVRADDFPSHPLRLVVPFPAGGPTDIVARPLAQFLSDDLKQQVIVDNRGGAGGSIGADLVAKSPADGYTLLMGTVGTNAINATLYRKLSYDPSKDFTPIALVAAAPVALVVHPSLGVHSMAEFIALAKAKPGTITFGTAGNGTPGHLTGEMFRAATATDLKHVPYRGSAPAVTDLIGGQINAMFDPLQTVLPYVQSGKLLLLGVSSATRSSAAPDAPTFAEAGLKGFEATAWWGVFAPANLPADIATRLNAAIERVVHTDGFRKLLEPRGVQLLGGPRADFARFNASELAKWGKAVRDSGATID